MKVDVSSIKYHLGAMKLVDEKIELDDLSITGRVVEFPEPIHLELQVTNSGDEYLVIGRVHAMPIVECNRCLEKFKYPLNIEFMETISKEALGSDNLIDLDDSITEHLILEMPIKIICDENCKGLCPRCGQNLNLKECGCDRQVIDPRLIKLKDFFNDKD